MKTEYMYLAWGLRDVAVAFDFSWTDSIKDISEDTQEMPQSLSTAFPKNKTSGGTYNDKIKATYETT